MDRTLLHSLQQAGKAAETITFADGSELLLLPYGGRILGLFPRGGARNFFWANPALRRPRSARQLFSSERWQNTGGQRAWIGPDLDFFYPKFPDLGLYHQPLPLDTGNYRVARRLAEVRLTLEFDLTSYRHQSTVRLRLTKVIEPAADPLLASPAAILAQGIRYAGYTLRSRLEIIHPARCAFALGLWNLIQMPHGGEMIIPTYGRRHPTRFFGKIPRGDLTAGSSVVRYRMRSAGDHKIALHAGASTGRLGYFVGDARAAQLVVNDFQPDAAGQYVDAPTFDPTDTGYCVQACSVNNPDLGAFSELEYHAPAIGGKTGPVVKDDVSRVWAYRGSAGRVAAISAELLGVRPREFLTGESALA